MPTFPPTRSAPSRYVWGVCGLLIALLLTGGTTSTVAQVPLQLLHRVNGPGQNTFEGRALPPGTAVVLLRHSASDPHTLQSADLSREKLSRMVLERLRVREEAPQLIAEGETSNRYPPTAQSDQIVYALARTPADSLFETYVNTGNGFVPGFDAIQSGRMTMGPVPEAVRPRYRAVFRVSDDRAPDPDPTAATSPDTAEPRFARAETRSSAPQASRRTAPSQDNPTLPSSPPPDEESSTSPVWWVLLGGVLGGLIGGGVGWWLLVERLSQAEEKRDEWRRKYREERSKQFREATGATLSSNRNDNSPSTSQPPSDPDELREENEQLREKNEALQRRIEEIKEYVQELREREE